jgi:tetratricopeptide (TPR) repeat protein
MQRRLNTRLLLWTLTSLFVVGVGVHVVHSQQMRRNASALLRQAERAVENKDFTRAASLLQQYLDYQPDDTNALAQYALILEQGAPSAQVRFKSFLLLEQVLRRQPDRHDLRRRAIQAAIDLGRYEDAIRHLEYLLNTGAARGPLEHQLGWCREALDQYEQAAACFRRAIGHAPQQVESYVLLSELLEGRLDQREEAARVMDALVAANPRSWQAHLARARFHYGRGELDAAGHDVLRAAELGPDQADVLLAAAEMALLRGDLDEARAAVQRGLKLHPGNERLYRSLAALEARTGHPDEAAACLRQGVDKLPASVDLRAQLAELYFDQGQPGSAAPLVDWLSRHGNAPALVDYLEGRRLILAGRWEEARQKLLAAREGLTLASEWAAGVCAALGRCYEEFGEVEPQLAAYRTAVQLRPSDPAYRLQLGRALLACRLPDDAAVELRHLAALAHAPADTCLVLGRALLEGLQRRPGAANDWKELDTILDQAAETTPQAAELTCLRAWRLALQGHPEEAAALLREANAARPGEAALRTTLAELLLYRGRPTEAAAVLAQARQQLGATFAIQQASLRTWRQLGGAAGRQGLVQMAREPGPLTREEAIRLFREMVGALLELGEPQVAETVLRQLADWQPRDLGCRVLLFDLALAAGRADETLRLQDELRALEGSDGVYWRIAEAARCLDQVRKGEMSRLALARQRLAEVSQRRPDWARPVLLEAYAEDLEGATERALEQYRKAIDLGDRSPAVVRRVARWLFDRQRYADTDQVIRQLADVMPLPADIARLGAEAALYNFAPARALELARQAVPESTRDYREHLWLARIQWLAGQSAAAEKTLRRLLETDGQLPDVWLALARHLARTQQQERVAALLQEMLRVLPADRADLAMARCLDAAGRPDEAAQYFDRALADSPDDLVALRQLAEFHCRGDRFARAEPYLRRLLDPKLQTPGDLAAWALRQLAVGLAETDPQQALKLLTADRRTWEDERVYLHVLGQLPERRAEAIRLLEESAAKKPLSADEQLLLAKLQDSNGDHDKAQEIMLRLLAFYGDNAQFVAYQVRSLLQRGNLDDARYYLAHLQRLEPGAPRTQQLQAAWRKAHNSEE